MRRPALLLPAILLIGCQHSVEHQTAASEVRDEPEAVDPVKVRQLRIDVIRGLIEKGQYYAALAHIEDQKRGAGDNQDLTYLEAETRRHLGQSAPAEALYRSLLGTKLEGRAYHGLGLLYAPTDIDAAILNLRKASERAPTDVEIRNDLGYALMQAGRYSEALPELSTAAELAPTQIKSRNNLIILMMLTGNQAGLAQLAQQSGTTPETLKQLGEQAQAIRNQRAARAARSPA